MARLGEALPAMLADRGVEVVFGVPGAQTVEFYRGLAASGLRHVSARQGQGAGFMADGYARASGRAAAVLGVAGPGLTSLVTPMAQALNCSIPMLVITASNPAATAGRGLGLARDLSDQSALAAGVARWSRPIHSVYELEDALDAAMAQFGSRRPGPVHLEVPIDILESEAPDYGRPAAPPAPPEPAVAETAEIVMRLSAASRPLLVFGGGAVGAAAEARALAEQLQAPALLTSNARGLLPPGHPLLAGGYLNTAPVWEMIAQADATLVVGAELSQAEWGRPGEPTPPFDRDGLIRIDIDKAQIARPLPPALGVVADARAALAALAESVPQRDAAAPDLAALRRRAASAAPERYARHQGLLETIWERVPQAVVVGDLTEPGYQGLLAAEPPAPRRWWSAASGFGALGYAVPAAIGAKVSDPRLTAIALIGDGGSMISVTELAAAVEAGAHVIALVWNNMGYGETREAMRARGMKPEAVDLSPVEFQSLARGLGCFHARVHGLSFLTDALKAAMMRPAPTVLELREEFWFDTL